MHLLTTCIIASVGCLGLLGNLLLLIATCIYKKLRTSNNIYVINLAITDLITCALLIPAHLITAHTDVATVLPYFCDVTASLLLFHCGVASQFVMWIALQRYVHVCGSQSWLRKLFVGRRIVGVALVTWLLCATFAAQGWTTWTQYTLDTNIMLCTLDIQASLSFNIVVVVLSVIFPFLVMVICYCLIIRKVDHSRSRLGSPHRRHLKSEDALLKRNAERQAKLNLKSELRLVFTLLSILSIFIICWLPVLLSLLFHQHLPYLIQHIAVYGVLLHACLNPVLYGVMNGNFRKCYIHFLSSIISCRPCKHDEYHFEPANQQEISTMACVSQFIGTSGNRTLGNTINVTSEQGSSREMTHSLGVNTTPLLTPVAE